MLSKITIIFLALIACAYARDYGFVMAEECNPEKCRLPDCRCSDSDLPKEDFAGKEDQIPQFITVTFDDALNRLNYPPVNEIFDGLMNSDNCSAHATFFVSHEYSDYSKINALYNDGHEIALHSVSHSTEKNYWRDADVETLMSEFGDEMDMLETFGYINRNHIRGMRLPFLQTSGNNSFIAAKKLGLLYDSSLPTSKFVDPPLWPYTLDYLSVQECQIDQCPDASIPGFWINPMVTWKDMNGSNCAMVDACYYLPNDEVEDIVDWMMKNFMRHYDTNRAPFGMYLHAALFDRTKNFVQGFRRFLEEAIRLPHVYVTTVSQVVQYMQNPVLGRPYKSCPKIPKTKKCFAKSCALHKVSSNETRYLTVCGQCPQVYPWLGNPLGLKNEEKGVVSKKEDKKREGKKRDDTNRIDTKNEDIMREETRKEEATKEVQKEEDTKKEKRRRTSRKKEVIKPASLESDEPLS